MRAWARVIVAALLMLTTAAPQKVQQNGVAIWQLPAATMNAMLTSMPPSDEARYDQLRKYFTDFGCTGAALEEQRFNHNGHHRNLLCKLPGDDPHPIVILASYPGHEIYAGNSRGWPDAVLLPILYHALSAEVHHNTYVFAALEGDNGAWQFFRELRKKSDPEPVLLVELNALGFSMPHHVAVSPETLPAKLRPTAQAAQQTAWKVAHFQGLDTDPVWFGITPVFGVPPSAFSDEPRNWPRIYVYSTYGDEMEPHYFRQGYDFLAFFLGGLDKALPPPAQPVVHSKN